MGETARPRTGFPAHEQPGWRVPGSSASRVNRQVEGFAYLSKTCRL